MPMLLAELGGEEKDSVLTKHGSSDRKNNIARTVCVSDDRGWFLILSLLLPRRQSASMASWFWALHDISSWKQVSQRSMATDVREEQNAPFQ